MRDKRDVESTSCMVEKDPSSKASAKGTQDLSQRCPYDV